MEMAWCLLSVGYVAKRAPTTRMRTSRSDRQYCAVYEATMWEKIYDHQ